MESHRKFHVNNTKDNSIEQKSYKKSLSKKDADNLARYNNDAPFKMVTENSQKKKERNEISALTESFLSRGGEIDVLPPSEYGMNMRIENEGVLI